MKAPRAKARGAGTKFVVVESTKPTGPKRTRLAVKGRSNIQAAPVGRPEKNYERLVLRVPRGTREVIEARADEGETPGETVARLLGVPRQQRPVLLLDEVARWRKARVRKGHGPGGDE